MKPSFTQGLMLCCWSLGLLSSLWSGSLWSQHTPYRQYTTLDGLPSNHVYTATQDSRGILWIGTDQGVARFDGENFRTFTTADGLPTNDIFMLFVDKWDRIWLTSKTNRLMYIENDVVKEIPPEKIPMVEEVVELLTARYTHDGKVVLLLNPKNRNLWVLCGKDSIHTLAIKAATWIKDARLQDKEYSDRYFQYVGETEDGTTLFSFSALPIKVKKLLLVKGSDTTLVDSPEGLDQYGNFYLGYIFFQRKDGKYEPIFHIGTKLYKFKEGKWVPWHIPSPNSNYVSDYSFGSGRTDLMGDWMSSTSGRHIIHLNEKGEPLPVPAGIQNLGIQSFYKDRERNIWLSTAGNGFIQVLPGWPGMTVFAETEGIKSKRIRAVVKTPNGKLYLGNSEPFFDVLDQYSVYQQPKVQPNPSFTGNYRDYTLLSDNSGSLYSSYRFSHLTSFQLSKKMAVLGEEPRGFVAANFAVRKNEKGLGCYFPKEQNVIPHIFLKDAIWWDDKTIAGTFKTSGIGFLQKCEEGWSFRLPYYRRMAPLSLTRKSDTLWVSEATGLKSAVGDSITNHPFPYPATIVRDAGGPHLWVATEGFGLYLYNGDRDTYKKLPEKVGPTIRAIQPQKDGSIWVADQELVHHVTGKPGGWKVRSYALTDRKHAPISLLVDSLVYVGSNQALYVMDPRKMPDSMPPPRMILDRFSVNEEVVAHDDATLPSDFSTPYDARNFHFDYTAISFWSMGHISYLHRLLGAGEEWIESDQSEASFFLLPPGIYTFEVKATDLWGQESEIIAIPFEVLPPWWRQGWFYGLIAALLLGLLYLGFRWYQNQERSRRVLSELQLQALQAQMNPHFVFNALSAIQAFILKGERKAANTYLTHFAGLMRSYLYASYKRLVSIQHEVEMLEEYLALQKLRMPHPFTYSLSVDPQLDVFHEIPALFLQPHVENAIQHGLLNKDGPGTLTIRFERANSEVLRVLILDDGIGRKAAEQLKQKGEVQHTSMGLQLVKDRKKMIVLMKMTEVQVNIVDLERDGRPAGTQVEIYFDLAD